MYTDPDPQFLAPTQSLEIGQECPFFRRADLATLVKSVCNGTGGTVKHVVPPFKVSILLT